MHIYINTYTWGASIHVYIVIIGNPRPDDSLVHLPSRECERSRGFLRMEYGLKRSFSRDTYIQGVGIAKGAKFALPLITLT